MANLYSKNFNDADEVKNPPKAKVQVVKLGNKVQNLTVKMLGCMAVDQLGLLVLTMPI